LCTSNNATNNKSLDTTHRRSINSTISLPVNPSPKAPRTAPATSSHRTKLTTSTPPHQRPNGPIPQPAPSTYYTEEENGNTSLRTTAPWHPKPPTTSRPQHPTSKPTNPSPPSNKKSSMNMHDYSVISTTYVPPSHMPLYAPIHFDTLATLTLYASLHSLMLTPFARCPRSSSTSRTTLARRSSTA
jgi:hypothetical protein